MPSVAVLLDGGNRRRKGGPVATEKKVKIYIRSTVEELGESGLAESSESSEEKLLGSLWAVDEALTLSYKGSTEGGEVLSEIIICGGSVAVRRRGAISSELIFTEGVEHSSLYSVGQYSFDASVTAKRIRNSLTPEGGSLGLIYEMTVGGAKKRVNMRIEVTVYDSYRP